MASNNNKGNSKNENFYQSSFYSSIERAILAEAVKFTEIKNTTGKFYLKVMAPTEDTSAPRDRNNGAYSQSNYVTLTIPAHLLFGFTESKFMEVKEIKHDPELACDDAEEQQHKSDDNEYILSAESESFTIPKDTVFVVGFLGGSFDIDDAIIIGVKPE